MAKSARWTGQSSGILPRTCWDSHFDNTSPNCGVDSEGNSWLVVSEWLEDGRKRVEFYRGDRTRLAEGAGWESNAQIDFPLTEDGLSTGPTYHTPCMAIDSQDRLYAWWYQDNAWQDTGEAVNLIQGVSGQIDAVSGTLTLGALTDLDIPYVQGFGPDWVSYSGLEVGPDGRLWIATVPNCYVQLASAALLYGDDLEVGTYSYALSYRSATDEMGPADPDEITTLAEAVEPGPPEYLHAIEGGGFGSGLHFFKVTFFKEDGTSGNGETKPGPAGHIELTSDNQSISLYISSCYDEGTTCLRNGGRKVYYSTLEGGTYHLIHTQNDADTMEIVVTAPVDSGPTPPTITTLPAKRAHLAGMQLGPPGTVGRRIYRTQANGSTYGLVGEIDNSEQGAEWVDDTGDGIGAPPPRDPASYQVMPDCLAVGHSNSPATWADGVTWEGLRDWDDRNWTAHCAVAPTEDGLAAAVYTHWDGTGTSICAQLRTAGGVWESDTVLVPSNANHDCRIGSLVRRGADVHMAYTETQGTASYWRHAPLTITSGGVAMGPALSVSANVNRWSRPRMAWSDDGEMMAIHGSHVAGRWRIVNVLGDSAEIASCDLTSVAGRSISDWTGPSTITDGTLWGISYDSSNNWHLVLWTTADRDEDCDEDECEDEEKPPCDASRSRMSSAWVGNSGGPGGGAPAPGMSGYVGGRPEFRFASQQVDLTEATGLRLSDSSGKLALTHPTTALDLRFPAVRHAPGPLGWNWTHRYHVTLTQRSSTLIDVLHESGRTDRHYLAGGVWRPVNGRRGNLVQNGDGTWTETTPYGMQYSFPATSGDYPCTVSLIGIADTNGNRVTLSYSGTGLESVLDAFGQRITFQYDAGGRVCGLTDIAGRQTTFSYSADSDLESVLHPDGARVTYTYADHDPIGLQGPLGETITLHYDTFGRLGTAANPAAVVTRTVTYDLFNRRTVIVDGRGSVWTSTWDLNLRPTQRTDPLGMARSNVWTTDMDATAFVDARGSRWTYSYDSLHRVTGMISPLLCQHSYAYNADNMPTVYVDPLGNRTTSQYDAQRNLIAEVHPDGGVLTYSYCPNGLLQQVQDARGFLTTHSYDARGNRIASITPDGAVTSFAYDSGNRLVETTNPVGSVFTSVYDAADMGRLSAVVDPLGNRTTYVYDLLGRQVAVVDPLGNRTTTQYNTLGQAEAQADALGNRVSYSYDANGNRIATIDPLGKVTTFVYDARDRLVSEVNPLGLTTSYDYDGNGNQRAVVDALGRRTTTSYDVVNRPTAVADPLNHMIETIYYTTGWVKATVDQLGNRTTYSYDGMGRQREVLDALGNRTTYSYDLNGNQIGMQDARGNRWTSVYDCMNRLTGSIDPSGAITTHSYDPAGRRTATLHAGGGRTSYSYDAANRQVAVSRDEG